MELIALRFASESAFNQALDRGVVRKSLPGQLIIIVGNPLQFKHDPGHTETLAFKIQTSGELDALANCADVWHEISLRNEGGKR